MEGKVEIYTQAKQQKEKLKNNEESLRNILDNMKCNNICIMGLPGEESEQRTKNLFEEIMTENFPNLVKEKDTQIQEAKIFPNKLELDSPKQRGLH